MAVISSSRDKPTLVDFDATSFVSKNRRESRSLVLEFKGTHQCSRRRVVLFNGNGGLMDQPRPFRIEVDSSYVMVSV